MPPVVVGTPTANRYGDLSITVPSGADYLLAGIGFGHGGVPTVGTATFNGDTCDFIAEANDSDFQTGSAFGRIAPDIATGNIVGGPSGVTARAGIAFSGVDQTTPVAANTTAIGLSTAPAATVSVPTDGLAVALLVFRGTGTTVTAGTDETVRVQYTEDSWGIAWLTKTGTGSVSFAPTLSQSTAWNIVALALNPSAGGAPDEIIAPASADFTAAWRQQLATWQQASGARRAPLAADVVPPADQIVVDDEAWTSNAVAWGARLATWQQATGGLTAPLADDAVTDISGSADGSVVFTGSASGTLANEGSATGAVVFGGSATGTLRIAGSATGVAVFGGSATGAQGTVNSGSATGAVRFIGSASGQLRNEGAATGAALFTGSAFGTLRVQGSAVGVVVFSGLASGDLPNEGSAAGAVVFTGSASGSQGTPGNAGSAAGSVVFTGAATGRLRVSGAASGVVVFRGAAGLPDPGSGDSSGRMRRKRVTTPYQFLQ
jgi:hypothetical protein